MKAWKWLIVMLIVALLAVYYLLGMDFLKQRRQNLATASQIENATAELAGIPFNPADLEERLANARADLTAAEDSFAGETNDTRIVNTVLQIAEENGVKATPLSTKAWAIENIFERDYSVFYLSLEIKGDFSHLQSFINRLETGEPKTLAIKYLKVENTSAVTGDNVTTNIDVAIYTLARMAD
jgi:hypothetical protein